MATAAAATNFFPSTVFSTSSSSSSSSSSSASPSPPSSCDSSVSPISSAYSNRNHGKRQITVCRAVGVGQPQCLGLSRRSLPMCFTGTLLFSLAGFSRSDANAAILEAEDDMELLEKVKKDRKKRLERQEAISSSNQEKAYLQELVYKLSKVGQAIDGNDLPAAGATLGANTDSDWVQKANIAFTKLSSSDEEKMEIQQFNSSISLLISSVAQNDVGSSKTAFVSSASALEKWTSLTGLAEQLKGL